MSEETTPRKITPIHVLLNGSWDTVIRSTSREKTSSPRPSLRPVMVGQYLSGHLNVQLLAYRHQTRSDAAYSEGVSRRMAVLLQRWSRAGLAGQSASRRPTAKPLR
jgi:hypothetical protein